MEHVTDIIDPVIVEWGEHNDEVAVTSLGALDAVLDRIATESDPTLPYVATIVRGDATMSVSQGPGWSVVSFAFVHGDGPFHVSLGDRHARGVVHVFFGGEATEQDTWSCIDPVLAREVVRHFYRTGGLAPSVSWVPDALWNLI